MGGLFFFLILLNCITSSLIFWLVSFLYFFSSKSFVFTEKQTLFECGFFTINKHCFSFSINVIVLACFVCLYESEFLVTIPLLFNLNLSFHFSNLFTHIFVVFVFFTLFLDIIYDQVRWVY